MQSLHSKNVWTRQSYTVVKQELSNVVLTSRIRVEIQKRLVCVTQVGEGIMEEVSQRCGSDLPVLRNNWIQDISHFAQSAKCFEEDAEMSKTWCFISYRQQTALKARGDRHEHGGMCLQRAVQITCWKCRQGKVSLHCGSPQDCWYVGYGADRVPTAELDDHSRHFKGGDGEFEMASGSPKGWKYRFCKNRGEALFLWKA